MRDTSVTFGSVAIAKCPYSACLDYVSEFMRGLENGAGQKTKWVPYRIFGLPLPASCQCCVQLESSIIEDCDDRCRSHEALDFRWNAQTRYLPNLHGVLCFRIAGDGLTELALTCKCEPPFGLVGKLFERLVGRRIARATGRSLLAHIVAEIEAQERAFCASIAAPAPALALTRIVERTGRRTSRMRYHSCASGGPSFNAGRSTISRLSASSTSIVKAGAGKTRS